LTSILGASGELSTASFSSAAHPYQPTAETNPQGNTLEYSYDTAGNVTAITNALASQNTHTLARNATGTLASVTNALGNVTGYGYDVAGNLTRLTPPSPLGEEQRTYDGLSRPTSHTDGAGRTTRWTYDALDRVTSTTFADGSQITYSYDHDGLRTGSTDGTASTRAAYDALGRPIEETRQNGKTNRYAYDAVGNITTLTDERGTVSYAYDPNNRLASVTEPGGAQTTFGYDAEGRRTSTAFPNGVTESRTYTASGQLALVIAKQPTGTVLAKRDYTYTNPSSGRKTELVQRVTDEDGRTTDYGYDALDRLVQATTRSATGTVLDEWSYTYDGAGNRLTATHNGTTTTASHNAANQVTQKGNTTYSYDAAGGEAGTSAGRTTTYNARASRNHRDARREPDHALRRRGAERRASAGNQEFGHSQLGIITITDPGGSRHVTRDPAGNLLGLQTPDGQRYYFLTDALGSVIGLAGPNGDLAASYRYDPYGVTVSSAGAVDNPWRFAGEYQDVTGLYKIGERYYDPKLGRWTQPDPLRQSCNVKEANPYLYAAGDLVNRVDPDGLQSRFACWQRCMQLEMVWAGFRCAPYLAFPFYGTRLYAACLARAYVRARSVWFRRCF
jgi:RHS repeat-associated protein